MKKIIILSFSTLLFTQDSISKTIFQISFDKNNKPFYMQTIYVKNKLDTILQIPFNKKFGKSTPYYKNKPNVINKDFSNILDDMIFYKGEYVTIKEYERRIEKDKKLQRCLAPMKIWCSVVGNGIRFAKLLKRL